MNMGERIRLERLRLGWTQKRLAEAARSTQANISIYERGEKLPRPTTLVRLAETLGVPLESLAVDLESDEMKEFRSTVHRLVDAAKFVSRNGYDPYVRRLAQKLLSGLQTTLDLRDLGIGG